jgi:hypothetical protein
VHNALTSQRDNMEISETEVQDICTDCITGESESLLLEEVRRIQEKVAEFDIPDIFCDKIIDLIRAELSADNQ